jgi:hypothetical protein
MKDLRPPHAPQKPMLRREAVEFGSLGLSLVLTQAVGVRVPPLAYACAFIVAALIPQRAASETPGLLSEFIAALPRRAATVLVTAAVSRYALDASLGVMLFGAAWPILAIALGVDWPGYLKRIGPLREEALRAALISAAAILLMRGFCTPSLRGGPDALWYSMGLADAVAQERSGLFPVFAGQSIYQFNGAMCPVRVAPAFQYLGMLLDVVTFRSLGIFALQNLLLEFIGLCGIWAAYLGLRALLPGRAWFAAGLAALFVSCPGVLGLSYSLDLFMSWTTLPVVPLVWFATVRSFQDHGRAGTLALLGATLGICWWGHPPIALWATGIAGVAQALRIALQWPKGASLKSIVGGCLPFCAIAAYPIGSVLLYPPNPHARLESLQHATPGVILKFVGESFPGVVLPLSAIGRSLGDLQLGYALWALLLVSICSRRAARQCDSAVPLAAAVALGAMLLPLPWICAGLWMLVPAFARDVTGNWAGSRLYIIQAAAIVFGAAACLSAGFFDGRRMRRLLLVLISGGCAWSFLEASKFPAGSKERTQTENGAVDLLRPENVLLTRYSYSMFPRLPDSFTHGVTDPELEHRLLARASRAPVVSNLDAALAAGRPEASGDFQWTAAGPRNFVDLGRKLLVKPDRSYLLAFNFPHAGDTRGVLEILGPHIFREYGLPDAGGSMAFGAGTANPKAIPVWTTTTTPEELTVRYYPMPAVPEDRPLPDVGSASLLAFDRSSLPVRVDSWVPYRARVRSPEDAWLETPRMYQDGYEARVDGRPAAVTESPDSLVSVAVPRGQSSVQLSYVAPLGLRALFWLSFSAIIVAGAFGAVRGTLHIVNALTRRCPPAGRQTL